MSELAPSSVDPAEVARFSAQAGEWWDPRGKFAPLHRLNPVRLGFIREQALARFGRDPAARRPFDGLTALDIGCGGGLVAEPLTRLGFAVTGIDAGEDAVGTARLHAERMALSIAYEAVAPEELAARGGHFDAVLAMEVIEHVEDIDAFMIAAAQLVAPGGILIAATLNRTLKSLALAKVGAEYVLRWVPAGTHDWRKFVRPSELGASVRRAGLTLTGFAGMSYDLLTDRWRESRDLDVNYFAVAKKKRA